MKQMLSTLDAHAAKKRDIVERSKELATQMGYPGAFLSVDYIPSESCIEAKWKTPVYGLMLHLNSSLITAGRTKCNEMPEIDLRTGVARFNSFDDVQICLDEWFKIQAAKPPAPPQEPTRRHPKESEKFVAALKRRAQEEVDPPTEARAALAKQQRAMFQDVGFAMKERYWPLKGKTTRDSWDEKPKHR